ncbi:hypothetical protein Bbelb_228450 [Branchiostoma belcheri]|nr:hypothetical protein Bbelb_228450 [Branchiostoma belcheri]
MVTLDDCREVGVVSTRSNHRPHAPGLVQRAIGREIRGECRAAMAPPATTSIQIQVNAAQNLQNTDTFGKSDPYCEIEYKDVRCNPIRTVDKNSCHVNVQDKGAGRNSQRAI